MSEAIARSALSRMHLREVALASSYTGFVADLQQLASTKTEDGNKAFLDRRAEMCAAYGFNQVEQKKPFAFANGIAIIPVSGTLINRFGGSYGWVTGYNFIRSQVLLASQDDDVVGIVLDVNSYGGEAAGCFECSDSIYELRSTKPIIAVIDSNAYSAGYALASGASKIILTPSGGAGSIGVVAMHVDMSKALADWGLKVTFIHSGDHKVDGNPYEPLPDDVKADLQAGIDKSRNAFVALVARNRGLDAKVVFDTEARCYRAEDALALGLIDAIASPSQAVQAFFDELTGSKLQSTNKGTSMSTKATDTGPANTQNAATAEQSANQARLDERARISGIQSCEEAKGRESLATHLAMNTEMSVDSAKAILAAAPKQAATAAPAVVNKFEAAMDTSGGPNVEAEGAGGKGAETESLSAIILRDQAQATGLRLVKN